MSMFDGTQNENRQREALLFVVALTAGANIGGVILHGLVAKGVFSKEAALSLLEDARLATSNIALPPGYENSVDQLFDGLKGGF
jgi:hypothetical protein